MPPYDSESSEDEGDEFTETNVLLGYASKDPEDDSITRLGGRPDWLDESSPPSAALARCKICKDLMVLLLQLNGELPDRFPGHERRLYVFACRKKGCRRREGSVRALRGVRVAPGSQEAPPAGKSQNKQNGSAEGGQTKPAPPSNLGETLFGAQTLGGTNPFSANPFATASSSAGSNPFASTSSPAPPPPTQQPATPADEPTKSSPDSTTSTQTQIRSLPKTFAETLSLNNNPPPHSPSPPEPWPPLPSLPPPYPISYLSDAEYETLDACGPAPASQRTVQTDLDPTPTSSDTPSLDRDVFESSMDAAFQRFADRVSQNPEQCIRYEFGGAALLYSRADAVGQRLSNNSGNMPRCGACGAPRVFEVQLCPRAIVELEAEEMSLDGMDWGTVIVGVCERDCVPEGDGEVAYVEEWVGVQWEELGGKGKGGR
ncbi:programmed cell death protein 2 [Biscogniauxia sp. FL1348]|nr:programmed cell death protein 2 [Biscogniauxia sp. FL1348]